MINNGFLIITVQIQAHKAIFETLRNRQMEIPPLKGEQLCSFLTGVVSNICHKMGVRMLKTECFEKEDRLALIMYADATNSSIELDSLRQMLEAAGNKILATVKVQKEELFRYMHRI
jgi:predicted amino acid-binding ACT domain protein